MRRIMERRYGLDKPVMEQFVLYASNIAKGISVIDALPGTGCQ